MDLIETSDRTTKGEARDGRRCQSQDISKRKLRRSLLAVNYGVAAIVFGLLVLRAEGFSAFDWMICVVFVIITPLVATTIQVTQIDITKGLFRLLDRNRR